MTDVNEVPVSGEPITPEVVTPEVPKPGEKTDPALLLKSLQEERDKRKVLEAELETERQKNVSENTGEIVSDEGKALLTKISTLEREIIQGKEQDQIRTLQVQFPALKDKADEFEVYRTSPEYAGMKLETAAKAFLAENELLVTPKSRKGLENAAGGGQRAPQSQGMTPEEIDNLRVTNYNEYARRIRVGTLK